MIEVDTNILVRYLTKDDAQQAAEATVFLTTNQCVILLTVLLETVWVLSSKNGHHWERNQIIERLRQVLGLPTVTIHNPRAVVQALGWYESGMDFADALHLANSSGQFATFDQHLSKKAKILYAPQTVILLGEKAP